MLRPPGTYNHKTGTPRRVTILHEDAFRLDPQELLDAPWLAPDPQARHTAPHSSGVADPALVVAGCAWLRHCRDEAAHLTEPHWHGMISVLGRCQDGVRWVHDWSQPYAGYSAAATDAKLKAALEHGAPCSCAYIRQKLDGEPFCSVCSHWERLKTPLALGFRPGRNGHVPGPEPETPWTYRELPEMARLDPELAAGASLWLDEFVRFARTWPPWGYEGFYEPLGLWLLSTVAARRLKIELGPVGIYPSLYVVVVARSSIYAKITTVRVALELLRQTGLDWLLAENDGTPQAFVRGRTLLVPANYGDLSLDDQEVVKHQLAFSAQRGWFYEEWGQHLEAMMRRDGVMAGFRGLLRQLDDHPQVHSYHTISRGIERLVKPYLSLLATATPADLFPFTRAHSPLWRDGYMVRLLLCAPAEDKPKETRFPKGAMRHSAVQSRALHDWHVRLGLPRVDLYASDKDDGKWSAQLLPPGLPETVYQFTDEVEDAYYTYTRALRQLLAASKNENLDASYARLPDRALRVALLLASLHDVNNTRTIHLSHWARGQQAAENNRRDLHHLMGRVEREGSEPDDRRLRQEQRLIHILKRGEWVSMRDAHVASKIPLAELGELFALLEQQGMAESKRTTRTLKYRWCADGDDPHEP